MRLVTIRTWLATRTRFMDTIRTDFDWANADTRPGPAQAYGDLQSATAETALRNAREYVDGFPGLLEFV